MAPQLLLPPLLQQAPLPIAALDLDGRVIDANRALLDVSGYSLGDLRGHPFVLFVEAGDQAHARQAFADLMTGLADSYRSARRFRTRDGLRDVELSVSVVRDTDGAAQMCLAILQDVTAHKRALADAARYSAELEAVIESMPAAVYVGGAGGMTLVNRAALDQLGFGSAEELRRSLESLSAQLENRDAATGERLRPDQEPFARALLGERVDVEVTFRHLRTRETLVQRVIAAPVRVGGAIVGAVAVNTDTTLRRRMEDAMRLSEARYRALVEQSPLSIQILSPDGRTLQVNSAWERLWGASIEKLDGYNMLEDRQLEARGLLPFIRQAFEGQAALVPASLYDPAETIPEFTTRDDPRRWVRAVIYPLKDDRGQVREVVLIHEDITDQVRADERRRAATETLQLVVEQSGEGIVVVDAQGIVRVFNPAAERLYGMSGKPVPPEEWSRHYRLLRIDGTPLPYQETALFRALHGQTVRDARWRVAREDGTTRSLVGTAAPLKTADGAPAGAVLIARDETDRLAAEAEREQLLVDTQHAHREVESASRLKDDFLATLSHELRTPLNAVLGWARILRMRHTDPALAHGLDVIERNAEVQARLIDDLLDVSRIIAGKIRLDLEPVNPARLAAAALETVRLSADARGLRLEAEIASALPLMHGDPQRLDQVLLNLLSNAIKFTDSGGTVRLSVAQNGRSIVVVVADTGVGIPSDLLPFVFDRFTQADVSSTRAHAGLGLGLAIVRHLVELHGGTVSAESPGRGQGATFTVCLPVAPDPPG